jgi:hypothetical protein
LVSFKTSNGGKLGCVERLSSSTINGFALTGLLTVKRVTDITEVGSKICNKQLDRNLIAFIKARSNNYTRNYLDHTSDVSRAE